MMIKKSEDCIDYWIFRLSRSLTNAWDSNLAAYGLTASQNAVLYQLWSCDGLTHKDIQTNLNLKAPSVTGLVDALIQKGFVTTLQDSQDCRQKRLYLTDKTKSFYGDIIRLMNTMEALVSENISDSERESLISLMKTLNKNVCKVFKAQDSGISGVKDFS